MKTLFTAAIIVAATFAAAPSALALSASDLSRIAAIEGDGIMKQEVSERHYRRNHRRSHRRIEFLGSHGETRSHGLQRRRHSESRRSHHPHRHRPKHH